MKSINTYKILMNSGRLFVNLQCGAHLLALLFPGVEVLERSRWVEQAAETLSHSDGQALQPRGGRGVGCGGRGVGCRVWESFWRVCRCIWPSLAASGKQAVGVIPNGGAGDEAACLCGSCSWNGWGLTRSFFVVKL